MILEITAITITIGLLYSAYYGRFPFSRKRPLKVRASRVNLGS